jgi:hypothetical protein
MYVVCVDGSAVRAGERAIFVAPGGNDAWSGRLAAPNAERSDGPVASPERARQISRELKKEKGVDVEAIHVYLRGGTYFLKEPLVLGPDDSGTASAPVVWSAYEQEQPILSGGERVSGWTPTKVNGRGAWVAKLQHAGGAPPPRELWLDGARLARARWPKTGTLAVAALSDGEKHEDWIRGVNEFRYNGDDLKAWPTAGGGNGEAIVANRWAESHLPITAIDEGQHVVHFGKRSVFLLDPGDKYWVENVRECLTEPGEFAVDAKEQTVTLLAPAGVDPNRAEVVVGRLAQVLRLSGQPSRGAFVEHLVFRGLGFAHTEWYFDHGMTAQKEAAGEDGEASMKPDPTRSGFGQAAIGVPGAVGGVGARSCTFERCTFAHMGTYGIELARGCTGNRIDHCALRDLGAGGVKIGEVTIRSAAPDHTSGNVVSDCTIEDGGNLFPSCVAVWIGQSPGNTLSHNDIHGFWYTGISIGWTWGYGPASAEGNVVESNHVHHIGAKVDGAAPILSDMACIYTLGNHEGTVIRNNRFHDVAGLRYGGWGIYFDEGTTHILAENNLVYRTTHGGFHQHYGKENTVRNNIFAVNRDGQLQRTRVEDHQSFRFERNIVFWERGPLLTGDWSRPQAAFDHNTYWRTDGGAFTFGSRSWDQWRAEGQDDHSKIADPHFVDVGRDDYGLTSASSAALAGFEPFDLSGVGPR